MKPVLFMAIIFSSIAASTIAYSKGFSNATPMSISLAVGAIIVFILPSFILVVKTIRNGGLKEASS